MINLFNYIRRASSETNIGATPLGGRNPIRIQSMTNTVNAGYISLRVSTIFPMLASSL